VVTSLFAKAPHWVCTWSARTSELAAAGHTAVSLSCPAHTALGIEGFRMEALLAPDCVCRRPSAAH
jgi:hypothetical protein